MFKTIAQLALSALLMGQAALDCQEWAGTAQVVPAPNMPYTREKPIKFRDLAIDVKVVANRAVTTWDITLHNSGDKALEPDLVFPLGEGQKITRFATYVGQRLREGVPFVKKPGHRAYFSSDMHKISDYHLLKKIKGNNFLVSGYRLGGNGKDRLIIAYEQELSEQGGTATHDTLVYSLPLAFAEELDSFSLRIEATDLDSAPLLIDSPLEGFGFSPRRNGYIAEIKLKGHKPNGLLTMSVSVEKNKPQPFVEEKGGHTYFYASIKPPSERRAKTLPEKLGIFWDASGSATSRDLELELKVLDSYLKKIGNTEISLVVFRNEAEPALPFPIKDGKTDALLRHIRELPLDGATRFAALDFGSISVDEALLFSDGMNSFGPGDVKHAPYPVIAVGSATVSDHERLKSISEGSGGECIDLSKAGSGYALELLTTVPLMYMGATCAAGSLDQVYPDKFRAIRGRFGISGLLVAPKAKVMLHFGYGGVEEFNHTVVLDKKALKTRGPSSRVWAGERLARLSLDKDKNKEEILRLHREYPTVTDEISLIELPSAWDYARECTEPPEDLREEYLALIAQREEEMNAVKKRVLDQMIDWFADRKTWWDKDYNPEPLEKPREQDRTTPFPLHPQTFGANVTVFDWKNKEPVADTLVVMESPSLMGGRSGKTNNQGVFVARLVPLGTYTLKATYRRDGQLYSENKITNQIFNKEQYYQLRMILREINYPDITMYDRFISYQASGREVFLSEYQFWPHARRIMNKIKGNTSDDMYERYLALRTQYAGTPSFFICVAELFAESGDTITALRVLSNLANMELEAPMLRTLGFHLRQLGQYLLAVEVFEKVLAQREEPQSYRDLALACQDAGYTQRAVKLLWKVVNMAGTGLDYRDLNLIALGELNAIIFASGSDLDYSMVDKRLLHNMPVDVRVVLNWNTDHGDMDLYVTDPNGEICSYRNTTTNIGGTISTDVRRGSGPEEFMLKKAIPGVYKVQADYFGDWFWTSGPTTVYLEFYLRYATGRVEKQSVTKQLLPDGGMVDIGEFVYE